MIRKLFVWLNETFFVTSEVEDPFFVEFRKVVAETDRLILATLAAGVLGNPSKAEMTIDKVKEKFTEGSAEDVINYFFKPLLESDDPEIRRALKAIASK
jgi:hypothetical protein